MTKLNILSGIYKITCISNNKIYIGSAKKFIKRWHRHILDLKANRHSSILLQRSYNKYGIENFIFEIVHICEYTVDIKNVEQYYMDLYKSRTIECGFNLSDALFGDVLSTHPDRINIIAKIKNTIKSNIALMTQEEKNIKYGKPGELNGRWNPSKHNFCKVCGKRISTSNKNTCMDCYDKHGSNNPFYGKTHSIETKQKISKANMGVVPPNAMACIIDGVTYSSAHEASRILNIKPGTIRHRILSTNKKYINYTFIKEVIT